MHVLTLIGCVLLSDVGLRDGGNKGGGEGRCGLNETPEFSLRLRRGKMKRRERERGKKSDQEEIKDLKAIDFLLCCPVCFHFGGSCILTLCYKRISVDFLGKRSSRPHHGTSKPTAN